MNHLAPLAPDRAYEEQFAEVGALVVAPRYVLRQNLHNVIVAVG